jgi:hypothetical protein
MRKIFLLLITQIFALTLSAQTLTDFNQNRTHKVTYDDYFNPTLHLTLTNVSNKTITSVEVSVNYTDNTYDWTKEPERIIKQVTISPRQKTTFQIKVPKEKYYSKPKSFWISKVRFSDATICDE